MKSIHQPVTNRLRVQTDLEGELARAVQELAEAASMPLSVALRLLALDGLKARKNLGA